MRKKLKTMTAIFAATTIAVLMASCTKEFFNETNLQNVGVESTINATAALPKGGDKAYLDYDDAHKVKWDLTDAINVNGTNLPLSNLLADPTRAQFSGTTNAIRSAGNYIYWAVYPTTMAGAASGNNIPGNFSASTLQVNFPATQTYNASVNALSGVTFMAGYASVPSLNGNVMFQMRNIGTVLKLNLTADANATNKLASRLEFSTTNGALAGDFTVDNTSDPAVTAVTTTKTLTVNLTDGTHNYIDLSATKDIYVILPPFASKNLTMKIVNTSGSKTTLSVASTSMDRNKIYTNTVSGITFSELPIYYSVSPTKKVLFAPGNLQFRATQNGVWGDLTHTTATGTANGMFRFAEHQWDFVGGTDQNGVQYGNVYEGGVRSSNSHSETTGSEATIIANFINHYRQYNGWIDMFCYGTSGYNNGEIKYAPFEYDYMNFTTMQYIFSGVNYPQSPFTTSDMTGSNAYSDWGKFNAIYNPKTGQTDAPGTWYTLTADEWDYLCNTRQNAAQKHGRGTVNGVRGIILIPDNFIDPNKNGGNAAFNPSTSLYTGNTYSSADWVYMEDRGCAFLPIVSSAGSYSYTEDGTTLSYFNFFYDDGNSSAIYWTSTGDEYYRLGHSSGYSSLSNMGFMKTTVRLVIDYVE